MHVDIVLYYNNTLIPPYLLSVCFLANVNFWEDVSVWNKGNLKLIYFQKRFIIEIVYVYD